MAYVSFAEVAWWVLQYFSEQETTGGPPPPVTQINSASEMAKAVGLAWPPPPTISLRSMLLVTAVTFSGPRVETPEVPPPFDEPCSTAAAPTPPQDLLDSSVVTYSELLAWVTGAPSSITYVGAEGRLVNSLRAAAQQMDPVEILKQSAVSFYLVAAGIDTRTPPDTTEGATALADLAVTGRASYSQFRSQPPQDGDLLNDVQTRVAAFQNPPNENLVVSSVATALDRAYNVAWALRDPNPTSRAQTRAPLGWIAVSGEDDSPDRPVNVPSANSPQLDLSVVCQGITVETRYMIALPQPNYTPDLPPPPIRQVPVLPAPSIPDDHEVILFIHGQDSNVEEANDLVGPLLQTGLQNGKKYALVAFDLPSSGYSQMIDHLVIDPGGPQFDTNPLSGTPATTPILDWLVQFVISFVNTLDQQVPIKNRIAAVIGGSLGGNLNLRLGERNDQPWIQNSIAWSPASVWESFNHSSIVPPDVGAALNFCQTKMNEPEQDEGPPSRIEFFYDVFDSPTGPGTVTQPQQWYNPAWSCQSAYIQADRLQRREIYNKVFRRFHWRVALEQLLFSHWDTNSSNQAVYSTNHTNTLLMSGAADNYPNANIYPNTISLAQAMILNTPGDSLFLLNTGHSIHNERPLLLAQRIVQFIAS
jgi:pimeloyl-ACP methyl ester carboxylesterase